MHSCDFCDTKKYYFDYYSGDFTKPKYRLPSYQSLLKQKYEHDYGLEAQQDFNLGLADNYKCRPSLDEYETTVQPEESDITTEFPTLAGHNIHNTETFERELEKDDKDLLLQSILPRTYKSFADKYNGMPTYSVTEKPNERSPSPVVPAYTNFELAKRMHHDNLDHQPLPDCVADLAYRKTQLDGTHPGLSLDVSPFATGVGVKMHNAGPTHCTKMKIFRPSTANAYRGKNSEITKKMSAMDLAIGWDYKPDNPFDEPQPPKHIDGSNDSAGPAVFNCVKTSRENSALNLGRSAGVFNNTLGESDFFDKDISRRKTDFGGHSIVDEEECNCDYKPSAATRARSCVREYNEHCHRSFGDITGGGMPSRLAKHYQSTPLLEDKEYKALRAKYFGTDACESLERPTDLMHREPHCKRNKIFCRPGRMLSCHKVAPAPNAGGCCPASYQHKMPSKAAFRVGMPKYNAAGDFISSDSACSMGNNRVLVVPRPRIPYAKKNYDIDTLVPPFQCFGGGAKQGGYPEHCRLTSVYQHAYKPLEQRRRPLLQTVYK